MRRIIFSLLVFFISLYSFANNNEEIKISANVQNYPDSIKVVLRNFETNTIVNETYILNSKFNFRIPSANAAPHGIFIGEGPQTEFLALFVEDVNILIIGEKGKIKYAKVKGGKIQQQHSDYFNSRVSLELQLDSLSSDLMKAMQAQDMDKVNSLSKKQINLIQEGFTFGKHYIKENPDKLYSAFTLKNYIGGLSKSEIRTLYEQLTPMNKESDYAKSVAQWLELNKEVKVGDIADTFILPDINGSKVGLNDFEGKFVLLQFWKLGCSGCVQENKSISEIYKKYKNKNLEIISISADKNIDNLKKGSDEFFISWFSLQDIDSNDGNVASKYGVTLVPTNFLIDPTGRIVAKDLKGKELEEKLNEIF